MKKLSQELRNLEQAIFAKRIPGRIDNIREAWVIWIAEHQKSLWRKLWDRVMR